ncbi:MAG: glycerol-3-phosphate 1-O-acyltransferase PlsY [Rhodospirillales bacterium]|nr:glycerol-3-phosphate 1-O-acyltransferase PlsY [Alphaproteobacteria bacterium]MCB9986842.1 glycerol-3-phosphate 1-O-acyltransferase PlsY [Rhodospirillales bacterium]USO08395.1 MAG: glycerol-3-phosphate 1-O-acyltransferase PlsY [Rhodospirillales bacterium]
MTLHDILAQHFTLTALAAIAFGYLMGSVPYGLLLTRLAGLGDVRAIGSGNIGATNVLRTGRKDLALATLILDSGKGAAAVLIAAYLIWPGNLQGPMGAALGAVLGHLYPVWLKFKGGKGVATTLGVLLAFAPLAGLASCIAWLASALVTRISSLSALVAMALAPFFTAYFYTPKWSWLTGTIALLVWWKHRANIARLIRGEEPKIGRKKNAPAS